MTRSAPGWPGHEVANAAPPVLGLAPGPVRCENYGRALDPVFQKRGYDLSVTELDVNVADTAMHCGKPCQLMGLGCAALLWL